MSNPTRSVLCLFPEEVPQGLEEFRQKYIYHPGKSVPFHITMFYNFLLPSEIDARVISRLKAIARAMPMFEFQAKPLSSFPKSKVLYLTPSPLTPIENLAILLYEEFPDFRPEHGFPVFHMTIALGYEDAQEVSIIQEYYSNFGSAPLTLRAHRLGICAQYGEEWNHCLSVKLGG